MPGSFFAEIIIQPVLEAVLQLAGYLTARVIVPVITFGAVIVEPIERSTPVYPKLRWPNMIGRNPRVLDAEFASLLGLVFWGVIAFATYLVKWA